MAQKAVRSEASSPNSLGPEWDWPEVRGEECRPRTVLSWLLAKWVVGESEEAGRRTLSSHGPENPEEMEIALSLRSWVPLAHVAEQKPNEDSPPGPSPGEGAALFSPSPEKEQTPTSPGCPRQGRFVDFLLTAARASMAVSSGSGAAVATTPEGGSPTAPSSSEDVNPSPDAAIDILSTDGAPWDRPAKSPGNRTGCSLREE